MTVGWALILIVATGLASAGFDLYQKILARWLGPLAMVFWLGLASVPLFVAGVWYQGWPATENSYWLPAVTSVVLNLAGHIAFVQAVRISDLSKTVPLLSLTPVFTAVIGAVLLGEMPGPSGIAGIVLVVAGAFWLHADRGRSAASWLRIVREPGALLMIGTALAWSVTIPLDKLAVSVSNPMFHGLILTVGMTLGAAVLLSMSRGLWEPIPKGLSLRVFSITLILCTAALAFQLLALTQALASMVETGKRGIANLMAVALGHLVFDESLDNGKIGSVTTMAVGVALILFGGP